MFNYSRRYGHLGELGDRGQVYPWYWGGRRGVYDGPTALASLAAWDGQIGRPGAGERAGERRGVNQGGYGDSH